MKKNGISRKGEMEGRNLEPHEQSAGELTLKVFFSRTSTIQILLLVRGEDPWCRHQLGDQSNFQVFGALQSKH